MEEARKAVQEGRLRYYPEKARQAGVSGRAAIDCLIEPGGWLTDCQVVEEEPTGWGFGETLLAMAPLFKTGEGSVGSRRQIPFSFKLPD